MTAPQFVKKGYTSKREYDAACARTRAIKREVLRASKSRLAHRLVLIHMIDRAEFDRPVVTITRPQIQKALKLDRNTVKTAYSFLKNEGSIEAIYNGLGGRGNAVTFLLKPPKNRTLEQAEVEQIERQRVSKARASEIMQEFGFKNG